MAAILSAAPTLQRPVLYNPQHLRRWRAAYGLADQSIVPVVVAGDSVAYGSGGDNTSNTSNTVGAVLGMCGRLQSFFAASSRTLLQNPGEGFIFPNESRVTVVGAVGNLWAYGAFGAAQRLIGASQTLAFTVPAGVTSVSVIQGNCNAAANTGGGNGKSSSGVADVTCLFNINGGANTNLSALTGTNIALASTPVAVTAGQVFQVVGPATAQSYVGGFILNSAAVNGVQVHRVSLGGYVVARLIGGQTSGTLFLAAAADQAQAARGVYAWSATPGLVIVPFCANDQQFQGGGGLASQNGVTLSLFQAWTQQFCNQAVADGWCVLLLGRNRNNVAVAGATLDQYITTMQSVAAATDHVAFLDVGESFGTYAESQADGLLVTADSHPNQAGHGDMAGMIWRALNSQSESGIVAAIPG